MLPSAQKSLPQVAKRQPSNCTPYLVNALSTAGNSMTSSEGPSSEPLLKKEASPAVLGGR